MEDKVTAADQKDHLAASPVVGDEGSELDSLHASPLARADSIVGGGSSLFWKQNNVSDSSCLEAAGENLKEERHPIGKPLELNRAPNFLSGGFMKREGLLPIGADLKRLGLLPDPADMIGVQSVIPKIGTNLEGLNAAFRSARQFFDQYSSITSGFDFARMDGVLGWKKQAAQYAAIQSMPGLDGRNALFESTRKLSQQYEAISGGFGKLGSIGKLSEKLSEQYAKITASIQPKSLEGLFASGKIAGQFAVSAENAQFSVFAGRGVGKEMSSFLAALEPLSSVRALQKLFAHRTSSTNALALGHSLATMCANVKSFPSILTMGASLVALGTSHAAQNWDALEPPTLLQAVEAVSRILDEDSQQNGSLSKFIDGLTPGANTKLKVEEGAQDSSAVAELALAAQSGDIAKLSNAAERLLMWMLVVFCSIGTYLAAQNGVREELCFLQPKLLPSMTAGQMGKAIRAAACDAPLELLKDYRFVRGESVRLRGEASLKAEVLPISLGDGDLLEVIDGKNRDWLHVELVGQEGVQGWVSRKYVRKIVN